ncbi:MAG TPA: phage holin family protein [Paracoccaceae bacterium]|nr:phage holin family protein [Paracoccaceae bacterium]
MADRQTGAGDGEIRHHVHVGHTGKHGPHDPEAHLMAETRSTPALIGDLITHVTELFRKELQLFRAEIDEKTSQVTSAGVMLALAFLLGFVGLIYLAGAAALGIVAAGLAPVWAVLIVGGVLALIALILALIGKNRLSATNLAPQRTVEALSQDAQMARERFK